MSGETLAVVDYGSGNLRSAAKALERAAREAGLDTRILVTGDPEAVRRADRIVLPGVGAFGDCLTGLQALTGMTEVLEEAVTVKARPLLGICVGMQLMAARGLEHGAHEGFGWIGGTVAPLEPADESLKIPHMGWNALQNIAGHPVVAGLPDQEGGSHAYFVHSYQFRTDNPAHSLAEADYGGPFTAIIGRDTLVGTQFHPEKSQAVGLTLLANFLGWRP